MDGKRSFQEIYERFQPGVLRFLSRLVGEEEAEDVAQEIFLPGWMGKQVRKGAADKMDAFSAGSNIIHYYAPNRGRRLGGDMLEVTEKASKMIKDALKNQKNPLSIRILKQRG